MLKVSLVKLVKLPNYEERDQNDTSETSESHDSWNEEANFDDEATDDEVIKEAEAGGSDILPVSSTSKLSANAGMPASDFKALQESDPAATLSLLLTKKWAQSQTSSERTQSVSTHSDSEIRSSARQNSLLTKLQTEYVQTDVLQSIELNPASAPKHLDFLKQLHNPLTDGETLCKIIQLESLVSQYAEAIQNKKNVESRLEAQKEAHAALLEKAQNANNSTMNIQ
jgi:uncharacterized protein YciI